MDEIYNQVANMKVSLKCCKCGFELSEDTLENNVYKIGIHLCGREVQKQPEVSNK